MTAKEHTDSDKRSAVAVGLLYIVATVAGVLTLAPLGALLEGPGILANAAAGENRMIMLAMLALIMAVAVADVAFMIYPVLMQHARRSKKAWPSGMSAPGSRRARSLLLPPSLYSRSWH